MLEDLRDEEFCFVGLVKLSAHRQILDFVALLMQELYLLGRALKKTLKQHLLINLFFDRQVKLLFSIGHEPRVARQDWLTELTEELPPEANVPGIKVTDAGDTLSSLLARVVCVLKDCVAVELDHCPHRDSLLMQLHLLSFTLAIVEEVAILARVELIGQKGDHQVVEFELVAHLMPKRLNAVEELQEDLCSVARITGRVVATPSAKHVAKRDPVFLDEHLEAFKCAIVGI